MKKSILVPNRHVELELNVKRSTELALAAALKTISVIRIWAVVRNVQQTMNAQTTLLASIKSVKIHVWAFVVRIASAVSFHIILFVLALKDTKESLQEVVHLEKLVRKLIKNLPKLVQTDKAFNPNHIKYKNKVNFTRSFLKSQCHN